MFVMPGDAQLAPAYSRHGDAGKPQLLSENTCGVTRADASHPEGLASAMGSVLNVIWHAERVRGPVASGESAKLLKSDFPFGDIQGLTTAVGDAQGEVHMIPLCGEAE